MRLQKSTYSIIIALTFVFCINANAQMKPVYTQYMLNQYLLNPGVAGSQDHWDLRAGSRFQWVGIEGSPKTIFASVQGPLGKRVLNKSTKKGDFELQTKDYKGDKFFHAIGGTLIADQTGPTSIISAYVSYTYNLLLTQDFRIGLGAAPGFQSFFINGADLEISNSRSISTIVPDLTIGVWLYTEHFYLGLSSHQVLEFKLPVYDVYSKGKDNNRLYRHYFINTGYNFIINRHFHIVPSVVIRYVNPLPVDGDLNVKVFYNKDYWAGITYRPVSKSMALMVGLCFNKSFIVSYSYDYYNTYLNQASFGTHELLVGYKFHAKDINSPSDFW